MKKNYIRIWQAGDIESIKEHLMIIGDLTGDCAHCREVGIKYAEARQCPQCGHDFKFATLRQPVPAAVGRIKERRPDLTLIDYDDYKRLTGRQSARDLFQ